MRKIFLIFLILFLATTGYTAPKGWNVAVDKITKEIKEISYGNSGYAHRISQGYTVITGVSFKGIGKCDISDYEWVDINSDNIVTKNEIKKKANSEIQQRKRSEKISEAKESLITLYQKKDKAESLGYQDIVDRVQQKISNVEAKLQSL